MIWIGGACIAVGAILLAMRYFIKWILDSDA
jgi:hypothetical protein